MISYGYLRTVTHHNSAKSCRVCEEPFAYGQTVATLYRRSGKRRFTNYLHPRCIEPFIAHIIVKQELNGKSPRLRREGTTPRERDKTRAKLLRRRSYLITKIADNLTDPLDILEAYKELGVLADKLNIDHSADHTRDPEKLIRLTNKVLIARDGHSPYVEEPSPL